MMNLAVSSKTPPGDIKDDNLCMIGRNSKYGRSSVDALIVCKRIEIRDDHIDYQSSFCVVPKVNMKMRYAPWDLREIYERIPGNMVRVRLVPVGKKWMLRFPDRSLICLRSWWRLNFLHSGMCITVLPFGQSLTYLKSHYIAMKGLYTSISRSTSPFNLRMDF